MKRALLMIALVVVGAKRADALCAYPMWNGTAAWTSIPVRGSLYVYDSTLDYEPHRQAVSWNGAPGTVTETKLAAELVRIDYEGLAGSELVVNRKSYRLASDWSAPASAPRVVDLWHLTYSWTCSNADLLNIQIDQPTAAVRVRWTYGGTTSDWVIPSPDTESTSQIGLGKINCGGTNIDPDQLYAGGHLELVAIRFDGSEVAIVGLPSTITTSMMRREGTDDDGNPIQPRVNLTQELSALPKTPAEPATDPRWYAIALFVLWLGAAIVAHRRLA